MVLSTGEKIDDIFYSLAEVQFDKKYGRFPESGDELIVESIAMQLKLQQKAEELKMGITRPVELDVPKFENKSKKDKEEAELVSELDSQYESLKNNSVGSSKIKKKIVAVVVAFGVLLTVFKVATDFLDVKYKVINGKEAEVNVIKFDTAQWHDTGGYTSWYEFEKMGDQIVENAYLYDSESVLSNEQLLAMIFGEACHDVIEEPNLYGAGSKYYLGTAFYDDSLSDDEVNGWAETLYSEVKEAAAEKGLVLPATLEEYLEAYDLDGNKLDFNSLTGEIKSIPLSKLNEEDQKLYSSREGMLLNLYTLSQHYGYINSLNKGGLNI